MFKFIDLRVKFTVFCCVLCDFFDCLVTVVCIFPNDMVGVVSCG